MSLIKVRFRPQADSFSRMEPRESTFFRFGFGIARLGTTAFRMMLGQKPRGFALDALDAFSLLHSWDSLIALQLWGLIPHFSI